MPTTPNPDANLAVVLDTSGTEELAVEVIHTASELGQTIATAESLTAGLLASTLADVPGASAVLRGGLIVYATELKAELAGVDRGLLERVGPVDATVAEQLAAGTAARCGATMGVGLTGVAGPDPLDGHEVGEVFIGLWTRTGSSHIRLGAPGTPVELAAAQHDVDTGSRRRAIRENAVNRALQFVLATLNTDNKVA